MSDNRQWAREAIRIIEADFQRSADTHLIPLPLPGFPGIELYFKDESSHPTGSLKHRLARSLFLYALCNGWLKPGAPVIEASSGSTAISEAYFASLLGLPFIAVMPATTSRRRSRRSPSTAARVIWSTIRRRSTPNPSGWLANTMGISSTSSPMPSALPTGGRTTTSPSRSSSKCASSCTPSRAG